MVSTYSEVNNGVAQTCCADEEKKDKCVKEKEAEEFVIVVAHAVGDPRGGGDLISENGRQAKGACGVETTT